MTRPPSQPPDDELLALFRTEIANALPVLTAVLRADASSIAPSEQSERAMQSFKGAARALGIAEVAAFVDAFERGLAAVSGLAPPAAAAALQVLRAALAYLSQLHRAQAFSRFIAATTAELTSLTRALEAVHAARDPKPHDYDEQPTDGAMLELFRAEVEQCTKALSDGVLLLDTRGAAAAPWEALMRAAHSLKGAARIVKLPEVAQLAHVLEECLLLLHSSDKPPTAHAIDALLQAIDALQSAGKIMCDRVPGGRAQVETTAAAVRTRIGALAERAFTSVPPSALAAATTSAMDQKPAAAGPPRLSLVQPALPAEVVLEQLRKRDAALTPVAPSQTPTAAPGMSHKPPAAAPPGVSIAALGSQAAKPERVLRVAADSINRLMGLAGESVVESRRGAAFTRSLSYMKKQSSILLDLIDALERAPSDAERHELLRDLKQQARAAAGQINEYGARLDDHMRRSSDLGERVYREALRSRMRPFGDGTGGLARLTRDLSHQLGKRAQLVIEGEDVEVDRDALEKLEAPLSHLLRNAIDHGLETAAERVAAGKPEIAQLRIEARHHAGMLSIAVSDDGRGVDIDAIRGKAVERGLASEALAAGLTRTELIEFLFLPGFSTARSVSEISGRGVGLDVVKDSVEALGGSVRASSEHGRGTTFHLQLPVTRSVVRAVVADVDGDAYAFPLLRIERIARIPIEQVKTLENREFALIDGQPIALMSARNLFEIEGGSGNQELDVIVISDPTRRYGIVVDALRGEHDLFVRPLDPRLGKVQDIAAAAILLDGTPALIIDVDDVLRSVERRAQSGGIRTTAAAAASKPPPLVRKRVLVVDDSIMVREAERQLLENRGYLVDVAVDGIDGWNSVRSVHYDLVITDVDMPRMNGIELVRSIKQDASLAATPVVIVSYKDREEDRMRGLEAGANYYLSKGSFDDDKLVDAVEDLIGGAAA
jgi:two-component system sensor histidine kinase and response regulator WspE